jgi:hypothetical protein
MKLTILNIDYHRNGICGAPFHAIVFRDTGPEGSAKLGIVFDEPRHCAVLDIAKLADCDIEFGSNSWRGDRYELALRRAIADGEKTIESRTSGTSARDTSESPSTGLRERLPDLGRRFESGSGWPRLEPKRAESTQRTAGGPLSTDLTYTDDPQAWEEAMLQACELNDRLSDPSIALGDVIHRGAGVGGLQARTRAAGDDSAEKQEAESLTVAGGPDHCRLRTQRRRAGEPGGPARRCDALVREFRGTVRRVLRHRQDALRGGSPNVQEGGLTMPNAINPFYASRIVRAVPPQPVEAASVTYARLPQAPITGSPVPHLTSLYHFDRAGEYGDRKYPGNCGGNLIKDLLTFFQASTVYDPLTGSGTCRDVCKELGIYCRSSDLHQGVDACGPRPSTTEVRPVLDASALLEA